jgi:hypothetical protein
VELTGPSGHLCKVVGRCKASLRINDATIIDPPAPFGDFEIVNRESTCCMMQLLPGRIQHAPL